MPNKFLLPIVISFLLITAGIAQIKINFEEYNLDNGLHVILHQDKSAPVVAVVVLYHVGSKNEKPGRTGFANFFEHLMFSGTRDIAPGEYYKLVQKAGGELNVNTSQDRTICYEVLPSNQLALGLWLESERMQYLRIDSQSVESQIKIINEEKQQQYNNRPYGHLLEHIFKLEYKVYPYSWIPAGSTQSIDKATVAEFERFYKTYYVPQNATLSISGDININHTKDLVKEYFGNIHAGKNKIFRPGTVEPPQTKEIIDTVYSNIQHPTIVEAYHIPAAKSKDFYPIDMLTNLLTAGKNSRLYKTLVIEQKKAANVIAYSFGLEAPGLFVTLAIANPGVNLKDLDESMNFEINQLKSQLISRKELQETRNQIETGIVNEYATNLGIAENLAEFHVLYGNTNLINTNLQRYLKVTRENIKDAADKYLRKDNRLVLYYLPGNKGEK